MSSNEEKESKRIALAPRIAGRFIIGAVDEVNGPASQESEVSISRYEALQLVRHWAGRYEYCDYFMRHIGSIGSETCRIESYAYWRVTYFLETGLVTREEVDRIFVETYERTAEAWATPTPEQEMELNPHESSPALDAWSAGKLGTCV